MLRGTFVAKDDQDSCQESLVVRPRSRLIVGPSPEGFYWPIA
jgi:hypothetical protein